jgi:hypothetical protein
MMKVRSQGFMPVAGLCPWTGKRELEWCLAVPVELPRSKNGVTLYTEDTGAKIELTETTMRNTYTIYCVEWLTSSSIIKSLDSFKCFEDQFLAMEYEKFRRTIKTLSKH